MSNKTNRMQPARTVYVSFAFNADVNPIQVNSVPQIVVGKNAVSWCNIAANQFHGRVLHISHEWRSSRPAGSPLLLDGQGNVSVKPFTVLVIEFPPDQVQRFFDHVKRMEEQQKGQAPVPEVAERLLASVHEDKDDAPPNGAVIPPN